jgi:hypothetical protein
VFLCSSFLLLLFNGTFTALNSVSTAIRTHNSEKSCYHFTWHGRRHHMAVIRNSCKVKHTWLHCHQILN